MLNIALVGGKDVAAIEKMVAAEIAAEFSRQSGKTTSIVATVEHIMIYINPIFEQVFGRPIAIGIFAKQYEQVKTDFTRLKQSLVRSKDLCGMPVESNAQTLVLPNGASCFVAPISPTSYPESKSLDLIIIEEAQLADDENVGVKILPMGKSTNAPVVYVGTAGFTVCQFQKLLTREDAMIYDWERVSKDRRKMYEETKNPQHLVYESSVRSEIEKHGIDSDHIKVAYLLKWILERGMFVTKAQLEPLRVDKPYETGCEGCATEEDKKEGRKHRPDCVFHKYDHYGGLDTAKHVDQTVFKIGRVIDEKLTVVSSLEIATLNYEEQAKLIIQEMAKFKMVCFAVDSTGQGDFMPDYLESRVRCKIERVTFSLQSKDIMYKSLLNRIQNKQLRYHWQADSKSSLDFEREMVALVKEYKQNKMIVHHPDEQDAHDDHPDSLALLNFAYDSYNVSSGMLSVYREKAEAVKSQEEAAKTNGNS